jgi:galactokinase
VVPGRVNLIGEHIDYHNLPVLPMAIPRHIEVNFTASNSQLIQASSPAYGMREFCLGQPLVPSPAGDWANYLKAAIQAVETRWRLSRGFHAQVTSNLPAAAGLSSSSALITAFTLGLLRANQIHATLEELMSVLPEGEHFVGTRGGGMDHAAVLASRAGHASLIHFSPFSLEHVPVPDNWRFLVAHSLTRAEKSGAANARYNACREAGLSALSKLRLLRYPDATLEMLSINHALTPDECRAFRHVVSEAKRVALAITALRSADRQAFGTLLNASHVSLRDDLQVSCPALDCIVDIATRSGADGARLTGAGFGGCAIILCSDAARENIVAALERDFYAGHSEYNRQEHLIPVIPANGALYANN